MAQKRKRPIEPTAISGEEAGDSESRTMAPGTTGSTGGGHHHQVQMEGEDVELQQSEITIPEGGGTEAPSSDMTQTTAAFPEGFVSDEDEQAFEQAVQELDPERQRDSIMKRKRAA